MTRYWWGDLNNYAKHILEQLHTFRPIHETMQILQYQGKGTHLNTVERYYIYAEFSKKQPPEQWTFHIPEQNLWCPARTQSAINTRPPTPHPIPNTHTSIRQHTLMCPPNTDRPQKQECTNTNSIKEPTRKDTTQHLHENTAYIPIKHIDKSDSDT